MTESVAGFLDTNILLYSISRDSAESQARAIALLDRDDWRLSIQVLQEFYVQARAPPVQTRSPTTLQGAWWRTWMRFRVQDVTSEILIAALGVKARYGFSYWDAAIIAAAIAQRCGELYSEDMSHGQVVEGVRIIDPFR